MTLTSQYAGTCKLDKSHVWKIGDQIFYDKATKAICVNEECFKKQKNPQTTMESATIPPKPQAQDKFTQAVINSNLAWDYATKKSGEIMPNSIGTKDEMILRQVFFKGIVELMK